MKEPRQGRKTLFDNGFLSPLQGSHGAFPFQGFASPPAVARSPLAIFSDRPCRGSIKKLVSRQKLISPHFAMWLLLRQRLFLCRRLLVGSINFVTAVPTFDRAEALTI